MGFNDREIAMINEDLNEEVKTASTEAPLSIHIDAYYKGFHAGITIRKDDNTKMPILNIKTAIEQMIEMGFEPSWNRATTSEHLEGPKPASNNATAPRGRVCEMHQDIEVRQSKNGKWYHKNEQTDEFCFGKGYIKFNK